MTSPRDIKPVHFLEVWRSPHWGICWSMRSFGTVREFNNHYDYHEHFYGQRATVHVGSDDFEITREELLKVATDHVLGNCKTLKLDLKSLTYQFEDGHPSTPGY